MTQQHSTTPPPELVRHWSRFQGDTDPEALWFRIANEAAQWGADQELEACIELIKDHGWFANPEHRVNEVRAARRPKPPNLKEQALKEMDKLDAMWDVTSIEDKSLDTIRRALEALPDD
jgi:hypothetical protein